MAFINTKPLHVKRVKLPYPIQCVIFDCDGVLVDSEILASQTALAMLEPYGLVMSQPAYSHRFAGKVEEDILAIVQKEYPITLPDDFLPRLLSAIEDQLNHNLQPIAGMKEVIKDLSLPTAIVSNSRLVRVIASLKTAGLDGLFEDNIFVAEMVERPKPAPDIYQYAARRLDVSPTACLVVEDSQSGVIAAHQAGMTVVGFLGASHIHAGHAAALEQAGAWTTISHAEGLKELFKQIMRDQDT